MSKAYLIAEAKVTDAVAYEQYKLLAAQAIRLYGGRYLARGDAVEVLEGGWAPPERMVIVEFDSPEQAKRFYESPEYAAARQARAGAAEMNMLVVTGMPAAGH